MKWAHLVAEGKFWMTAGALHFRVRSSSTDEVYEIEAIFSPRFKLTCTCQGGLKGTICKHRAALLAEDASSAIDVDPRDLRALSDGAKASPLGDAMQELESLEAEAERIKKRIIAQKKQVARIMHGEAPSNASYAARY